MAGNLPVPQGATVKLVWAFNGTPFAINVWNFSHDVGAVMSQTKANAVGAVIQAAFSSSGLVTYIHSGVSLLRVEARHMDQLSDPWFVATGITASGGSAANPLPAATAFVVTLKTGLRGRSFNGRTYLWGYTEDANDTAGGIAALASTASVQFLEVCRSNLASAQQWELSVLSRFTTPPTAPPNTPPTERPIPLLTEVTQCVALDQRWDVQRRRAVPGI